jgi:hypothetical protein
MPFEDRDRVIGEFRRGETKILIATDVLARGFDVSQVRAATSAARVLCVLRAARCHRHTYCHQPHTHALQRPHTQTHTHTHHRPRPCRPPPPAPTHTITQSAGHARGQL